MKKHCLIKVYGSLLLFSSLIVNTLFLPLSASTIEQIAKRNPSNHHVNIVGDSSKKIGLGSAFLIENDGSSPKDKKHKSIYKLSSSLNLKDLFLIKK